MADRVEFRVADYREVADGPFDAIASIGMVEHVGGEQIDLYARRLYGLLRPGGRLLNHGIAKLQDFDTPDEGAFSERFVFPDGVPLPLSRVQRALERAGLVTTPRGGPAEGLRQDDRASGSSASTPTGTTPCGWPGSSERASGACTSGRRGRASRPAGRRCTRCSLTASVANETHSASTAGDQRTPDATHFTAVYPVEYRRGIVAARGRPLAQRTPEGEA